jgi:cathepsin B
MRISSGVFIAFCGLFLLSSAVHIKHAEPGVLAGGLEHVSPSSPEIEPVQKFLLAKINAARAKCNRPAFTKINVVHVSEQVGEGEVYRIEFTADGKTFKAVVDDLPVERHFGKDGDRVNILKGLDPSPCGPAHRALFVQEHNQQAGRTWDASVHEEFDHLSDEELASSKLGYIPPSSEELLEMEAQHMIDEAVEVDESAIPESFDWRTKNPNCVAKTVLDQGSCGSCYAFASATALSYRMCISSKGNINTILSPQDMASCHKENGCDGGQMTKVYEQMKTNGKVVEACDPYTGKSAAEGDKCESVCSTSSMNHQFKVKSSYNRYQAYRFKDDAKKVADNAVKMQQDVMDNGPVAISFNVHKPFYSYKRGVYLMPGGELDDKHGWHAVVMLGWGVENGVKYWICQNSWGEDFGEGGYFKIKRGVNEANVELYGIVGASITDDDMADCTATTVVRNTGCWYGGCRSGEVETEARQCWNLFYDETCVKASVNCQKCVTSYSNRWTGCSYWPSCDSDQEIGSEGCGWGRRKKKCRTATTKCG